MTSAYHALCHAHPPAGPKATRGPKKCAGILKLLGDPKTLQGPKSSMGNLQLCGVPETPRGPKNCAGTTRGVSLSPLGVPVPLGPQNPPGSSRSIPGEAELLPARESPQLTPPRPAVNLIYIRAQDSNYRGH